MIASEPVNLRGSKTEMAKAKQAPAFRTASVPATQPKPKTPGPESRGGNPAARETADKNETPRLSEMRTLFGAAAGKQQRP